MKTIKMLVLVLVTVAGSAWAADFSGLPALRSSGIVSVVEADPPMPGPAETSRQEPVEADPLAALNAEIESILLTTIDLDARMWALRIQAGEFSAEALKGESAGWIISEEYKASLFVKIEALLRAGSAAPLTKAEHAALKAAKEKVRQLFQRRAR